MKSSDQDRDRSSSKLGDISFDRPPTKEGVFPRSRMKLNEEDPFSLKVIEKLEREGLFIRWRFGYRLANRYEVRRICAGGMGIVWIVEDLFDNRKPYAAKSVKPFFRKPATDEEWKRREESIQRFLEECKIWVDLEKHRHIVYAEFLEKIEGVPLVMSEYIEGGDLIDRIKKGPFPVETVLDFAIQFCIGMEYANSRGVLVHKDIKPGNLMVDGDVLKINDFGLSKAIGSAEAMRQEREIEAESTFDIDKISISRGMGTPFYMAPEQFSKVILEHVGFPVYPLAISTDVFSLALVLYEMIKGKHPYIDNWDQEVWNKAGRIASEFRISQSYIYCFLKSIDLNLSLSISGNEQLDYLILKCLRKNPVERYQSFTELKEELLVIYHQVTGKQFEIIEESPPKPNFKNKGKTAFILGREEESIKFYDMALDENPGDTDVWFEKGLVMAEMGKFGEFGVCMEIIPYLKPSEEDIIKTQKEIIINVFTAALDLYGFSGRDLNLLDDIARYYPEAKELKGYILNYIEERRYNEVFKDLNSEVMRLLIRLRDEDDTVRLNAVHVLHGLLGKKYKDFSILPDLISALKDEHVAVRAEIVHMLGSLGDPSAIPYLVEALNDKNIRDDIVMTLGQIEDPSARPVLVKLLKNKNEDPFIRGHAAIALGHFKDPSVIPVLLEILKNKNETVFTLAGCVEALGKLKDPTIVPFLVEVFKNESKCWFHSADCSTIPEKSKITYVLNRMKRSFEAIIVSLIKLFHAKNIVDAIDILNGDNLLRKAVLEALIQFEDPSIKPVLIDALKNSDHKVRIIAVDAIGELRDFSVKPALIETLKDKHPWVRLRAVFALGELDDQTSVPFFIEALKDKDPQVRGAAAIILGRLNSDAVIPFLLEMLKDKNEVISVKEDVLSAIGKFEDPSIISIIIEIINNKEIQADVRETALIVLGERKDRSTIPLLIDIINNGDEEGSIRYRAVEALGNFKDPSVVPFLVKHLKDPFVRVAVITALETIEEPSAIPALLEVLKAKNENEYILGYAGKAVRHIWSQVEKERVNELREILKPYSALEFNKRGQENLEVSNTEEAKKCFGKAIEIDPDWEEPKEKLKKCQ
jgi:HEAT repeat protein/serine/threonine protein kinase